MKHTIELNHDDLNSYILSQLSKKYSIKTTYERPRTFSVGSSMYQSHEEVPIPITFVVVLQDGKEYQVDNLKAIYDSEAKIKS